MILNICRVHFDMLLKKRKVVEPFLDQYEVGEIVLIHQGAEVGCDICKRTSALMSEEQFPQDFERLVLKPMRELEDSIRPKT